MLHGRPLHGPAGTATRETGHSGHDHLHSPCLRLAAVLWQGGEGHQALVDWGQHRGRRGEQADHSQSSSSGKVGVSEVHVAVEDVGLHGQLEIPEVNDGEVELDCGDHPAVPVGGVHLRCYCRP